MADNKKIKTALVSVFHKENLDLIIRRLNELNVKILSTGGTKNFIESLGVEVTSVESLTGYPSILGGRVKTLHPKVFGGILSRRENQGDVSQLTEYEIPEIDLVIVDLYPFEDTVNSGAVEQEIIEKIDIGGISLIRAAAKNFKDVVIVPSQKEYKTLLELLNEKNGESSLADRKWFAGRSFAVSSHYDAAIFSYFNCGVDEAAERISLNNGQILRYGENPHQKATFFKFNNSPEEVTLANAKVLQGKALSYNNMLDADAAWKSASDAFHSVKNIENKVAVSVVKHLNPCGLAVTSNIVESLELAWAGDPISAFGSIICFTSRVTKDVAEWFANKFVEIVIAPEFSEEALEVFSKKKNLRLLVTPVKNETTGEKLYRSISGGMLVQDEDEGLDNEFENVTEKEFDTNKISLAKFGVTACKHLKSNAIAIVTEKENGSFWLTGAGMGQPNRLDSLRHLTMPRFQMKEGLDIEKSILVSDAFFPFRDSIEAANEYGVKYIIEPGGSIRDKEVIEACNEFGIAMAFTRRRHFKH
ncbi:MAG: bifunctional phosphoribosylaminoimidazolecarboxamide formyltransferase/IMP cyclohydrolase [Prolixibacteraceae bacterium]|jgi:phosphoribosylaminoimidazolecarboxamide formyltransferase / IMP cyclohydrolase|nr:bifunctional phosphoribosylaminoimidazolecarboxamide formyltransferase/IMP cyclohydrolase [Prolixibacteraceae bacterium]MBT6006260.1 bifunctional phosphoribosylaminoimidazolecarboxamide formyltransferase/IMP cyclohydrolase [Prolixibacteraceae bacterium]MBT6763563.1 bifunctional phosphoribosylaminoimidazolecarboxamide formyltransferase/IMP cyclohydrolase [Prolixibacteraceae bacterium]MBT6997313.1 bifunctional phosphoribosylaminoimidazolecarboxamide formyltransferase/IMP cyclohydrolase [Prolixi